MDVFNITGPLFLLIGLGFTAVRMGIIEKTAIQSLARFLLYFGLPALLFQNLSRVDLATALNWSFLSLYALGSLATFTIVSLLSFWVWGNTQTLAVLKGFGASMSNSAFIGYPLLLQSFESPPLAAFSFVILVENLLMLPLVLSLLERSVLQSRSVSILFTLRSVLVRVFRHPIMISILAALLTALFKIPIPQVINTAADLLTAAAAPVALFMVGGSLVGTTVRGNRLDISVTCIAKLLIHPLMMFGLVLFFPDLDPELKLAAILLAAAPMVNIYPIFGVQYGYANFTASTLLVTISVSFFTITALLWWLLPDVMR